MAAVQAFYKLYLVPGMAHGTGNGSSNPAANPPLPTKGLYGLLTDWVENGVEPGAFVVDSATSTPVPKSQPLCPHPQKATCNGSGDVFAAASYTCS